MAIVNGYCTVEDLRSQIDDSELQRIDTALIERAISAVSRAIDKYCGFPRRRFWRDETPTTHTYTPTLNDELYVTDIASRVGLVVQIDGTAAPLVDGTDFVLGPANVDQNGAAYAFTKISAIGSRLFPLSFTGKPTVSITGIHGWSEIPDEVVQACIIRSTSILKRKDAPFGVAGFGEFGTAVRIRAEDPDVADLLGPFVRYGAGTTG